jgi:hypothetical protein
VPAESTQSSSKLSQWVDKHKKVVYGGIILIAAIIFFIVLRNRSNSASSPSSSPSSTTSTVPSTYNSGGGEYGGGYSSNNYGQIQAQLATIASDLSSNSSSQAATPTGNGTGYTKHNWPYPSPAIATSNTGIPAIFENNGLAGLPVAQAEQDITNQGWVVNTVEGSGPTVTSDQPYLVGQAGNNFAKSVTLAT